MRIIGAGLPRTGTSTLRDALNLLDLGPCYHTSELLNHLDHIGQWLAAYQGGPVPFATLAGYQATADSPGCFFWRELAQKYPDAKVVLTVREPRSWYASMANTVLRREVVAESADPTLAGLRRLALAVLDRLDVDGEPDEVRLIDYFHRHNAEVRQTIPADRLLVYEVREGWAPLCDFLGVPVPDQPFPWLNSSAEYVARVAEHQRLTEPAAAGRAPVIPEP